MEKKKRKKKRKISNYWISFFPTVINNPPNRNSGSGTAFHHRELFSTVESWFMFTLSSPALLNTVTYRPLFGRLTHRLTRRCPQRTSVACKHANNVYAPPYPHGRREVGRAVTFGPLGDLSDSVKTGNRGAVTSSLTNTLTFLPKEGEPIGNWQAKLA